METILGPYVLGLDIGVASIGWAIVPVDKAGNVRGVHRAGAHLFEAGIDAGKADAETAMMQGREQSKAKPRRDARAMRRQTWRRARRKKKVLGALIRHGLLPEGDIRTPAAIDAYVKAIDATLREAWENGVSHVERQNTTYRLRTACATRPVERFELGRALYHLAQRRGFLSNRKTPERDDETSKGVKAAIGELAERVAAHDPPTLGAYLASLDPSEERIRARWTGRSMYLSEFETIWERQREALGLTDEAHEDIRDAIFHQRPLKDQRHLIGRCSLTGEPRAPLSLRVAQQFRVLQQVNHLRVLTDDYHDRALTEEERAKLLDTLLREGDRTMAKAKKAAGIPSSAQFSIERGGEKKLVGHRVDARLHEIFGERWDTMTDDEKDAVVHDVRSIRLPETLRRRGVEHWGLAPAQADEFQDVTFEEGHAAHSRAALERLVARMLGGMSYSEARMAEFPESFESDEARDSLPPVMDWEKDLRNPSVTRALTELRKVVNAIVRRHGKPVRIHVELARDLKQGRSRREAIAKRMRDRQRERERAAELITREMGWRDPRPWQIEKWLLAEECGWRCPFTGQSINARALLGSESQYDVEHIWPFSKSLDDSFMNKTLCYHDENRHRKRGRTPRQAYGGSPKVYEEILERVRAFKGDRFVVREKVRRFEEEIDEGFTNRHLSDTRYIGRMAAEYLGLLYGGRVGEDRTKRIVTPSGGLTAWMRRGWGLNGVLSHRDEKERADHRHHAIDAVVIALAGDSAIKRLSDAAERVEREGRERAFGAVEEPWDGFFGDVKGVIDGVVVSHRTSRGVRGKLHDESLYSKEHDGKRRLRKELSKLSEHEVDKIVDARARDAVRAKLAELGIPQPSRAFAEPANLPRVKGADGRDVPLRRVRLEVGDNPRRFGRGERERWANPGANHHAAFYDRPVPGGGVERIAEVVTLAGAYERLRDGRPVIDRAPRGEHEFAFSVCPGDFVQFDEGVEHDRLCRVRSVSADSRKNPDIELVEHADGRMSSDRKKDRIRLRSGAVRKANFHKVHVTHLGEIKNAGG